MNPNKYKTKFQGASTLHKNSKTRLSSRTSLRFLFLAAAILALLVSGWSMFAAPSSPAINLDQASNGGIGKTPISPVGWENGNQNGQKAHYNEGESIPYRARLTGLTAGKTYKAVFGYDITHSSKHAIDYITSNNRIAETVNPCQSDGSSPDIVPCVLGAPGDIPAPTGGTALKDIARNSFLSVEALEGNQQIKAFNGDISVVEFVTEGDPTLAQSETTFRVIFTASGSNPAAGATTTVLSWGGHIARSADWGAGQAATGINGSPYHTRAKSLDVPNANGTGFNTISIGNQDRSLASSAVQAPSACLLSGDGDRYCGAGSKVHTFSGTLDTSSTYSFSIVSAGTTGATINATGTNTNPNLPPIQATVDTTAAGTYTIRLTVSNAAGSETCDATVTVDQAPVAAAGNDQEVCNTGAPSDLVFTVDSSASSVPTGGSVSWSVVAADSTTTATFGNSSAASTTVTLAASGTVKVRLTVSGASGTSCTAATDDVVLTANAPPTVSIALENECSAGTADLKATASGGTGTIHYQWKKDTVDVGSDSATLHVTEIGTYSVTVTDGKSCTGGATKKLCFSLQNAP